MTTIRLSETAELTAASAAQAEAADPHASAWVAANAGSGKTKVLIDRVARLLLRGAEPDQILCVTYTKAAANEMLSRLFERLGRWSVMDTDRLQSELQRLEGREGEIYSPDELRRARMLFANALETPGGLRIETIHAFCSRILRRFPLEAGIGPGFKEIEDSDARALWADAVAQIVSVIDEDADLADALDLLADASGVSGARRALDIIKSGRSTLRDHARQHDSDVDALVGHLGRYLKPPEQNCDELIETAWAGTPLDRLAKLVPVLEATAKSSDAKLAEKLRASVEARTASEFWEHYRSVFLTQTGSPGKRNGFTGGADTDSGGALADLLALKPPEGTETTRVLAIEEALKRRRAFDQSAALYRLSLPILRAYARLKRERNVLDFEDLIDRTAALLSSPGLAEWVLYKLDGKLSHVLLDEAQDTSPKQWTLLRALTSEFYAGQGAERPDSPRTQFVVGDEKQSIYSFQGADPDHFGVERRDFIDLATASGQAARQPQMAMSFRSTPQVLSFVDACWAERPMVAGDLSPERAQLDADEPVRHIAHRSELTGCVELRELEPAAETAEPDPWTAPVDQLSSASSKLRLARWIASRCHEMIEQGHGVWSQTAGGPCPSFAQRAATAGDILILVQNRAGGLFDAIIGELKAAGLPVAGADRLKPTDHIGVQDCLNLMRFALFPADDLTLAEILKSPFLNLIDDQLHLFPLLHGRARGKTLWSRIQGSDAAIYDEARDFLSLCRDLRHRTPHTFLSAMLLYRFSDGSTARDRLATRLGSPVLDPQEELISATLAHDAEGAPSLQTFLHAQDGDDTDIKRDLARPDGEIRVMTVHGAKGLEAPIVILADTTRPALSNQSSPLLTGQDAPPILASRKGDMVSPEMTQLHEEAERKRLAEHNRLLYVALTSAQDRLIICGAARGDVKTGFGKNSWFETCLKGLERLATSSETDSQGLTTTIYGSQPPHLGKAAGAAPDEDRLPDWFDTAAAPAERREQRFSPSRLTEAVQPVRAPFSEGHETRFLRGKLIHALLEFLPERPADERAGAAHLFLDGVRELRPRQKDDIIGAVLGVLDDPELAAVFGPGSRAEVPVTGRLKDGRRVEGRVDRLLLCDDEIMIVDFKTDRPPPRNPDSVDEAYLVQMAAYAEVLGAAFPGRIIRCALLWTDGPDLMELRTETLQRALTDARARLQAGTTPPN